MTTSIVMAAHRLLSAIQQPGVHIEATPDLQPGIALAIEYLDAALTDFKFGADEPTVLDAGSESVA